MPLQIGCIHAADIRRGDPYEECCSFRAFCQMQKSDTKKSRSPTPRRLLCRAHTQCGRATPFRKKRCKLRHSLPLPASSAKSRTSGSPITWSPRFQRSCLDESWQTLTAGQPPVAAKTVVRICIPGPPMLTTIDTGRSCGP